MAISDHIEKVREGLRSSAFPSEAAVSQGIFLPALHELGWPVFDTAIVIPEFSLEKRRVDFALCHPAKKPAVFVEVKQVGGAKGADKQLFEYAFHEGVPMAILTDGQEWSFYLPGEQGRYDERRVYKLDLLERNIEDATDRLERYLSYERVCSGEALKAARSDYQTVARKRAIENALPGAWSALLEEPDSPLLELLADKVEDLCGYKPALDSCAQFLEHDPQGTTRTKGDSGKQVNQAEAHDTEAADTREPVETAGKGKRINWAEVLEGLPEQFTSKDVIAKVNKPPNAVYTQLYQMTKAGRLKRTEDGYEKRVVRVVEKRQR